MKLVEYFNVLLKDTVNLGDASSICSPNASMPSMPP